MNGWPLMKARLNLQQVCRNDLYCLADLQRMTVPHRTMRLQRQQPHDMPFISGMLININIDGGTPCKRKEAAS